LLLREAAKQGHVEAMKTLGGMHRRGKGVRKNDQRAEGWYVKAGVEPIADEFRQPPGNVGQLVFALTTFHNSTAFAMEYRLLKNGTVKGWRDLGIGRFSKGTMGSRRSGSPYPFELAGSTLRQCREMLQGLPEGVRVVPVAQIIALLETKSAQSKLANKSSVLEPDVMVYAR
jgi:hypothetical protein